MTTGREDEDLISDLHVHVIYMDIGHTCRAYWTLIIGYS